MANINEIVATFDQLKPAVAADFTAMVTQQVEDLIARYPTNMSKLGSEWGRDGNTYRNVSRFINGIYKQHKDEKLALNTTYLAKQAAQYADDAIAAFTYKLVQKLGDLTNVEIKDLRINSFTFRITGKLGDREVYVEQNRIINVSPKGTLFHQWPSLIYVDGKKTSEKAFKALAAE